MSPFFALLPILLSPGPRFDLINQTRQEVRVLPKAMGRPIGGEVRVPIQKPLSITPFSGVTAKGTYLLSLRRPNGSKLADLKFRGLNLLSSRRAVRVELTPGAALVRMGSRRFRVLFVPENRVFKK